MDEMEFIKSYDAYADAIFRHCYFRLYDREEAKDAVQETFLRAWKYSKDNRIDNVRALLYKIARNIVADKWRKKKTLSLDLLLEQGFEPSDGEHKKIMLNAEAKNFIKLLNNLDDNEREIVIMRYVDGLGPDEIAKIMSERAGRIGEAFSANVVSVRLNRAINKIQKLIQ
ncbi:hypothetical protein A2662_02165 [Candidatus Giovannonibacteria bacterium RIFCSPHIGHO2_01_FULL_45_33]|uniref:RNA polymerase sigma-70 region 2 domain-containing protein n=1 Tax=Candidatus Giovannonibacteria bacterium RIFCSPLOWO2_01_FULL_45_34 TaxID=1798351 RepID=A0A1F5X1W6_9BACT|nr:MAG: hypothetical protein A2662_02165 [Candidatus Giovannonibacteria bacterium RIFCSPHIGHO2_01_FULL_45_33]OGF70783.1 MAG: hypothetical protein A3C73_02725 [Candidatus Giovannonibacteria bacterium RIFCSPHIGHO2_02_FULL_44_11]OGF81892.1 MAG: hypothetical protein A2930_00245 [Candidatus Giovannonibacteria bacterium RIFCSPLOWO2_01_FULL_45_34]